MAFRGLFLKLMFTFLTQKRKERRENLYVLFVQQGDSLCDLCALSEQGERELLKTGAGLSADAGGWWLG